MSGCEELKRGDDKNSATAIAARSPSLPLSFSPSVLQLYLPVFLQLALESSQADAQQ